MTLIQTRNSSYWFLVIALLLPAASCRQKIENPYDKSEARKIFHQNGLSTEIPKDADFANTPQGFLIHPPPSRSMSEMSIFKQEISGLDETLPSSRNIIGRTIKYRIERNESGGSGGDEYTIKAQETVADGIILYGQTNSSESSEPTFDFFWFVVEKTSPKN